MLILILEDILIDEIMNFKNQWTSKFEEIIFSFFLFHLKKMGIKIYFFDTKSKLIT